MKTEVQTKTQVFTMKKCRILSCVCAFQTLLGSDILSLNPTWKPKIQSDDRRVGLTAKGGGWGCLGTSPLFILHPITASLRLQPHRPHHTVLAHGRHILKFFLCVKSFNPTIQQHFVQSPLHLTDEETEARRDPAPPLRPSSDHKSLGVGLDAGYVIPQHEVSTTVKFACPGEQDGGSKSAEKKVGWTHWASQPC